MIKITEALVRFTEEQSVSEEKVEEISQRILQRYHGGAPNDALEIKDTPFSPKTR